MSARRGASETGLAPGSLFDVALHYVTDGSFEGWLCAVFDAYARGETPAGIAPDGADLPLGPVHRVEAEPAHAARVRAGLDARAPGTSDRLYRAFLSEAPGIEHTLFRLATDVFARGRAALADWRSPDARAAERLAARTHREMHRMHAFVRFEEHTAPEGTLWRSVVRPVHHVLPLLTPHFASRFPTLRWAIADVGRGLALVHTPAGERPDGAPPTQIVPAGVLAEAAEADREAHIQAMWHTYIAAVTIPERRNLELQRRHVPRRYWAEMTEMATPPTSGPPTAGARGGGRTSRAAPARRAP